MPFISNPCNIKPSSCFAISEKDLVLKSGGIPLNYDDILFLRRLSPDSEFFFEDNFSICVLDFSDSEILPEGFEKIPLRQFFAEKDEKSGFLAARSRAIIEWRKVNKFCASCGSALFDSAKLSAKECPDCKKIYFPRIEPCIIVLVRRGEEMLLVRHTYRNQNTFACIAGFMEAGESAEQAVYREVYEETGLKIKNLQYKGSQGWPYPDQLMIAFTADYESGELKLQKEEIAEAVWFKPGDKLETPKPGSVAYRLIHNLFTK